MNVSVGCELALVRADRGRDAEDQKGRSVVILVWLQRARSLTEVVNFMVNRGGATPATASKWGRCRAVQHRVLNPIRSLFFRRST